MPNEAWLAFDDYISNLLIPADPVLQKALDNCDAAGIPRIGISPAHGKFLQIMARLRGAQSILEIGTLGAYSTIWLARSLPESGRLITLEFDPLHAKIAKQNIEMAGLDHIVEIRLGDAGDTLDELIRDGAGPFDMIFIDADKPSYPKYLSQALKLSATNTLIVADNVVRNGAVMDSSSLDPRVQGIREFNEMMAREPRIDATIMQTVGARGYDGLAVALVKS